MIDLEQVETKYTRLINDMIRKYETQINALNKQIVEFEGNISRRNQTEKSEVKSDVESVFILNASEVQQVYQLERDLEKEKQITNQIRETLRQEKTKDVAQLQKQYENHIERQKTLIAQKDDEIVGLKRQVERLRSESCSSMDEPKLVHLLRIADLTSELYEC